MASKPRTADSLADYLADPSSVLPEPVDVQQAVERVIALYEQSIERYNRGEGRSIGATFNLYFGSLSGQPYYAVALYSDLAPLPESGIEADPHVLRSLIVQNWELLLDPRNNVGLWYDDVAGLLYPEVSAVMPDKEEAISLAKRHNQIDIFDLERGEPIVIGGTGIPVENLPPPMERLPPLERKKKTMSEPFKVSRATAVVDVAAFSPGDNPTIEVVYHAENSRGVARRFVRQLPVPDVVLFGRIRTSVKEGEQIEATTVNEWYDTGYVTYLADFKKVPGGGQETVANNGTINAVQNGQSQIKAPPLHIPRKALAGANSGHPIFLTTVLGRDVSLGEIHDELNKSLRGEVTFEQSEDSRFIYNEQKSEAKEGNTLFLAESPDQWLVEANVAADTSGYAKGVSIRFNIIMPYAKPPVGRIVCQLANVCKMMIHQHGKEHSCPHVSEDAQNHHDCAFCEGQPQRVDDQEAEWVVPPEWDTLLDQRQQLIDNQVNTTQS